MLQIILGTALYFSYGFLTLIFTCNMFIARKIKLGFWTKLGVLFFWPLVVLQCVFLLMGKEKI